MAKGRPPRIFQPSKQAKPQPSAGIAARLEQALAFHQEGQFARAESVYREILAQAPAHVDALHFFGVLQFQRGLHASAVELIGRAIRTNSSLPAQHSNLGLALHRLGRLEEALASYGRALALKPDYAEALSNRGDALQALKRTAEALASYDRALAFKPDFAEALANRGPALRELGRPEEALASYDRALALRPDHAEALYYRGNVLQDLKRPEEALASYDRALALRPGYAEALNNRGNVLLDLERPEEALASCERALALNPDYAEALGNRGNALRGLGRREEALASYDRALALKPDLAGSHVNRGTALQELGRPEEALAAYDRALALRPDYAEALNNRGNTLRELRRLEEALASYDRALAIKPGFAGALSNRGNALRDLGRLEEALASHDRALAIAPDHVEALNNRGNVLQELKRPEEALASYERALELKPDYPEALSNRGAALQDLYRPEEALASYDRAIALRRDYAEAHANRGTAMRVLKRLEEALASYARALAADPDYAHAHFNEGVCRLLTGDYERGWQKYEWRFRDDQQTHVKRDFGQPLWLGRESLAGRTILLHAEQGLGDTIQFCRYARLVAGRGATVLLEVQPALKPLLAGLQGVERLLAQGEPLPGFDYHCPLLSLPLAFGTRLDTIPADIPYLGSDPRRVEAWRARLGEGRLPRVGLAWSGRTDHRGLHTRSIQLSECAELLSAEAQFVSLQKEVGPADRAVLAARRDILHFGDEIKDFADTAALVELMDGVIAVDTSVAHLAGAMGKPVWVLLRFAPDWRWLLEREDSPWYPGARLFRQPAFGDWASVIGRAGGELRNLIRMAGDRPPDMFHRPAHAGPQPGDTVKARLEQAVTFHQKGHLARAEAVYREILAQAPAHVDALHFLGVLQCQKGQHASAVELIGRAISMDADQPAPHSNMGLALHRLGRQEEALACFDRALALKPDYAEALSNRGDALQALKRQPEALASYDRALALRPEFAEALANRGAALRELKRPEEALASYDRALALRPDYAEALYNRGNVLQDLGRPEEALASYDRALALRPESAEALNNRANALQDLNRPAEALASCDRALALRPVYAEALSNRGNALQALKRPGEALASYARALALMPEHASVHLNGSLCRLLTGDFERGWRDYEWRWREDQLKKTRRDFAQPLWLGRESLAGRTILLHAEQGLGDTIQFCRYARLVAGRGATVLLEVQPALKPLLAGLQGVERLLAQGEPLPGFDYHCPLLSLPLAFGTRLDTIPADIPYLGSDPRRVEAWRARLGEGRLPRVGLVWSGGASHRNDRNRSIALAECAELLSAEAQFVSLQKEVGPADRAVLAARRDILHFDDEIKDFADTAALVELMDGVIAVDTSVAHLAGAMGKPVWILLPFAPDWRWLLEREDSPWYPGARLFRQPAFGDWASVIGRARNELLNPGRKIENRPPAMFHQSGQGKTQPPAAIKASLDRAVAFHQAGQLALAEPVYRDILAQMPAHFEALHLLGVLQYQKGQHESAAGFIGRAIGVDSSHPAPHSNLGLALQDLKRPEEALASYDRALALAPDYAEALNNRGTVLQELKRAEEALASFDRALALKPGYAEALNNRGTALQDLGRLEEALASFDRALALKPDFTEVLGNRASVLRALGRPDEALASIDRALALKPHDAEALSHRGTALQNLRRLEEALASHERALALKPDFAEALNNRGNVLRDLGRPEEALASYDRALALRPDYAEALNNRGNALHDLDRTEEALASYGRALGIRPDYAEAHNNLGNALTYFNRYEEALASYRRALALRPDYAEAHNNLGSALNTLGRHEQAMASYQRALSIRSGYAEAHNNLGTLFKECGLLEQAQACFRQALALKPNAGWKLNSMLTLPVIPDSVRSIQHSREEYALAIDRLLEDRAIVERPDSIISTSYFLLAYHGCNDRDLLVRQAELFRKTCPFLTYEAPHCARPRGARKEKLRIGFASRFLRDHTIGRLMQGVIANLSRQRFEVVVFLYHPPSDDIGRYIAACAGKAVIIPQHLEGARRLIADQQLDVLFYPDIGMEPLSYLLAFSRLAPLQCATWGHPDTTGISTVDCFISHEDCETAGSQAHYSEKLVALSSSVTWTCYRKPTLPVLRKSRADFGLDEGKNLYLCPQSLFKIHPEFDEALAGILRRDDDGIVVLVDGAFSEWTGLVRRRFQAAIPDVTERIRFVARQDSDGFFSLLSIADVVLDTFHFGGGNTSFEAFALGKPVVTLPASYARGRFTYALYKRMGIMDCVADDAGNYVQIALRLGTNPEYRESIRRNILARHHLLFDDAGMVVELERILFEAAASRM